MNASLLLLSRQMPFAWRNWVGVLACSLCCVMGAQAQANRDGGAQFSAYTCIDANGRKLTSDRVIAACMDREQRQLLPNGTVRIIPPKATLQERAAQEEQRRQAQLREHEEARKRAELRALLARYPDRAALDQARAEALKVPQTQIQSAQNRLEELAKAREAIDRELEFYVKNPERVPPVLRRKMDAHEAAVNSQRLEIANHNAEAARINQRFDEEALRLMPLWR